LFVRHEVLSFYPLTLTAMIILTVIISDMPGARQSHRAGAMAPGQLHLNIPARNLAYDML
jgi:hypothetical protein